MDARTAWTRRPYRSKARRRWPISRMYGFVRSRELERTIDRGAGRGVYGQTAMRVACGWGTISETRWPYDGRSWPPAVPPDADDLDRIAQYNRLIGYHSVRTVNEAKACIASGIPFVLCVRTTKDWVKPAGGVIPLTLSRNPATFLENHAVCVLGYDDETQHFTFVNSWGPSWGDNGCGYLPYSYMRYYMSEAWVMVPGWLEAPPPRPGFNSADIHQGVSPCGHPVVQTSTYNDAGVRTGWCFAVLREGRIEVEDFFVRSIDPVETAMKLAEGLVSLHEQCGLPIRVWVSHCDADKEICYNPYLFDLIEGLGLTVHATRERWANSFAQQ